MSKIKANLPLSQGIRVMERIYATYGRSFPNSDPSSKHRRAHKRICGTNEGYTKLVVDSEAVTDDEHHSDDEDKEKTPSPKIEKRIIKESSSSGGGVEERSNRSEDDLFSDAITEFSDSGISPGPKIEKRIIKESSSSGGGVEERSNRSEDDLFSDAITEFSDSGISPDATKPSYSPTEDKKADENFFESPNTHSKDADKTEENDINTVQIKLPDSDMNHSVPLVEDSDGSHKDKFIDFIEPSKTVQMKPEMFDNRDQGEEVVYALSVPSDIPLVGKAETLIKDFKNHKAIYSNVHHGDKYVENRYMVDTFKLKRENTHESQTSEHDESSSMYRDLSAVVPAVVIEEVKVAETRPSEMSKTVPESTDNNSEAQVSFDKQYVMSLGEKIETEIKKAEIVHNVPVLTEIYPQETVKEPKSGIEAKQTIVETVVSDLKDSSKVGISETLQDCGVDASLCSSSRNSLEGNWGSVSVLSTASIDAENAHSIGKSGISEDKSHLGKSDAFEGPSLVKPKEESVEKAAEIKAVTAQKTQPPKTEANVSNETEGRKRNEEAIAKVTNWSTSEHIACTPLKNLVMEAKSSSSIQLSTMIQKDEAAEKTSEPGMSNLTQKVNQESSPPKYIGEGKKVKKKSKGIASWVPFACCSSVNVT